MSKSSPDALPTAPAADAPMATYNASCTLLLQPQLQHPPDLPTNAHILTQVFLPTGHCGAFTYKVTQSPPLNDPAAEVIECNCSICLRNGYLFIYVPDARVEFTNGSIDEFKVNPSFSKHLLKDYSSRHFDTHANLPSKFATGLLLRLEENGPLLLRQVRRELHGTQCGSGFLPGDDLC